MMLTVVFTRKMILILIKRKKTNPATNPSLIQPSPKNNLFNIYTEFLLIDYIYLISSSTFYI